MECMPRLEPFIEYFKSHNDNPGDILASHLYASYLDWCEIVSEDSLSVTSFGLEMKNISCVSKGRSSLGIIYKFMPKMEPFVESISIQPVIIQSSVSISDSTIYDNKEPIIKSPDAQDKSNKEFDGFVYCFANESMPGILKIGMTKRDPLDRLKEANSSDTWRPPTPYTIEFAKHVTKPREKESVLHKLLSRYTEKIHDRREFFRVSVDEVRLLFELMDGDYWEACK